MSAFESLSAAANGSLHFASAVVADAQGAELQLTNEPADEHVAAHIVLN